MNSGIALYLTIYQFAVCMSCCISYTPTSTTHLIVFLWVYVHACISLDMIACFTMYHVFSEVMTDLYNWVNPKTEKPSPMISKSTYDIIMANSAVCAVHTMFLHSINVSFVPFAGEFCRESTPQSSMTEILDTVTLALKHSSGLTCSELMAKVCRSLSTSICCI